jgi:hypothetical protein
MYQAGKKIRYISVLQVGTALSADGIRPARLISEIADPLAESQFSYRLAMKLAH